MSQYLILVVLNGHSRTWRPTNTHKAICSLTTTWAREASVLYGHSKAWQSTNAQDNKLSATPMSFLLQKTHRLTSIQPPSTNQSLHLPYIGNMRLRCTHHLIKVHPPLDKSKIEWTLYLPFDTKCRTTIISLSGGAIHLPLPPDRKQIDNHHIW